MAVECVVYEAEGWGVGELWFEGTRLVWHELPRPRPEGPPPRRTRRKQSDERLHPHPGGVNTRLPLGATLPAKRARVGNESGPIGNRLVHQVRRFFAGERVDFREVELDIEGHTPFQLELTRALRSVPFGEVVSYSELAKAAGRPNAQRAAGTFCAHNRFPLVVPCHRVVAANGIGSYGSLGIDYKRRLLELEGVTL